jgi:hypothetical protein
MRFTPIIAELVGVNWEDERVGRDGREEHGQHSARHEAEAEEAEHHGDAIRHARKKERTRLVDAGNYVKTRKGMRRPEGGERRARKSLRVRRGDGRMGCISQAQGILYISATALSLFLSRGGVKVLFARQEALLCGKRPPSSGLENKALSAQPLGLAHAWMKNDHVTVP